MSSIRDLFSTQRPIDRPIEKVIDYYATDDRRLKAEIEEYEVTDNLEACFQKFIDNYGDTTAASGIPNIGIWVSGFYGSGKSSFTKYLGFALDADKQIDGDRFLNLLCNRFKHSPVAAGLLTMATKQPCTVVMLDLGAEQLVESATVPVSSVLYWKVLQWAGYSRVKKTAHLELLLERKGQYDRFKELYESQYDEAWTDIHNDALLGVTRASEIVHEILPGDFKQPDTFGKLRSEEAQDARNLVEEMIAVIRRKAGRDNILFLIDEAGQYVAHNNSLILNLDGFARNVKELGKGKVWVIATGQQTLAEIVEKAAVNSQELNKLRDRFPVSIHIDASDIKEITYRRLLTKSVDGTSTLKKLFELSGQATIAHSALAGTALYRESLNAETFVQFYPFLPQHFDLLLELIRSLARSTGGIGLRSAIRVIQDVLVDASNVLPTGVDRLADRPVGSLATIDYFYDVLRADIGKVLPHVIAGVERTETIFPDIALAVRVAKAVAALQPLESFPKTAENIAALLYSEIGAGALINEVRDVLSTMVADKDCGLIEDPQSGGFIFLSEGVRPIREERDKYHPTSGECNRVRNKALQEKVFPSQPAARIENIKDVRATVRTASSLITDDGGDLTLRIEFIDPSEWDDRRTEFLSTTNSIDYKNAIVLLARNNPEVEDLLPEVVKSEVLLQKYHEYEVEKDVAQYLRAQRKLAETNRDRIGALLSRALLDGTFIFRGKPTPVAEMADTTDAAMRHILGRAGSVVFDMLHLMPVRPATDAAAKFLDVERIDRIPSDIDPLRFVVKTGSTPRIDADNATLKEVLRVLTEKSSELGSGRVPGKVMQDVLSGPPYGWTKDAARYALAALLRAGQIQLYASSGVIKTAGPTAVEAMKNTNNFNSVGVAIRDSQVPIEALDRAARLLQDLFGVDVLPLEDHISEAVRRNFPAVLSSIGSLPDRLRLLGLAGEERAASLKSDIAELLQEDASGAAGILGVVGCAIPADVKWAKSASKCLSEGGEDEIRDIGNLLLAVTKLEQDFRQDVQGVVAETDEEAMREFLGSEDFPDRLPNIRGVADGIRNRLVGLFRQNQEAFDQGKADIVDHIQSMPEWSILAEDDRAETMASIDSFSVPEVNTKYPWDSMGTLLIRVSSLPKMRDMWTELVKTRVPITPPVDDGGDDGPAEEEEVALGELVHESVLRSRDDVEALVGSIKTRLMEILKANKYVRLRVSK
ncbi:MAG: BREX system P-loop protein BrxC [Armatimonadota bacterium]|nr:BREX system P-loop protein BrxC [bacterium]